MANGSNDIHIEEWMIKDLQITGTEVMCFAVVYCYSKNGGSYYGGLPSLAERLGMPEVTLGRVIKRLVAKGFLHCTHISNGGRQYCDLRSMKTPPSKRQVTPIKMIGDTNQNDRCTPSKRQVSPIEMIDKYNKENNKDNKDLDNNNKDYKPLTPSDEGVTFEQFWDAYDYKKSKKAAERAWNRLSKADKKAAMNAIQVYKQDCVRCGRDMQYAQRYLKEKTFEDDFSFNDNKPNNNERDNIRRGAWPTPTENATRAEEWATNRILELTQPKDKGIQGEIPDNRDTDKLFLPF